MTYHDYKLLIINNLDFLGAELCPQTDGFRSVADIIQHQALTKYTIKGITFYTDTIDVVKIGVTPQIKLQPIPDS